MQNTTIGENKLQGQNSFLRTCTSEDVDTTKKPLKRLSVVLPKKIKKSERVQKLKMKKSDVENLDSVKPKCKRTINNITEKNMNENKKPKDSKDSLENVLKLYNKTLKNLENDQDEEENSEKALNYAPITETNKDQLIGDKSLFRRPVTFFGRLTPDNISAYKSDLFSTKLQRQRLKAGDDASDDLFDPCCDPANPVRVTVNDVNNAASTIKDFIKRTPCTKSKAEHGYGMELYFKKEFLQFTGSFKERGARYALSILPDEKKKNGVISASAGNHAQALCYQGMKLKIPVVVVMPTYSPTIKIQRCRDFKATVIIDGSNLYESKVIALRMAKAKQMTYINGYDHPDVIAGQGTAALEILEQVPDPYAIIVPVGGGSLLAGTAATVKALSRNTLVIAVESEKCPSFSTALEKKQPAFTPVQPSVAEGLSVPLVGFNSYATAAPLIDKMLIVKEEWIALGITRLVEEEKCVTEGAGAAGFAAILQGLLPELKGKRVVVILTGGNIDTTVLVRCLERGMALEGRLIKFTCQVSDKPGGMRELCDVVAAQGATIVDVAHERAWVKDIFTVEVKVVCETRDWDQALALKESLTKKFQNVNFPETPAAARCHQD